MPASGRAASGRREALTEADWQRLEVIVTRMLALCIVFLLAATLLALAFYAGYVYRGVVGG